MFFQPTNVKLVGKKNDAPRLVIVLQGDDNISNIFVLADEGVVVDAGNEIPAALITLLMCYYVWDLSYPKHYQLLGFLQTYVLEDTDKESSFFMSQNYIKFVKEFEKP